ncbi:MAG: hypothetical protein ABI894_10340, partial [Ilumatobacteraceae bacterium]
MSDAPDDFAHRCLRFRAVGHANREGLRALVADHLNCQTANNRRRNIVASYTKCKRWRRRRNADKQVLSRWLENQTSPRLLRWRLSGDIFQTLPI